MIQYSGPLPDGQTDTELERAIEAVRDMLRGCGHVGMRPCIECHVAFAIDCERRGIELGIRQAFCEVAAT